MKRTYIIPAIKVRKIKPTTVLAGSDITIAGGGEETQPTSDGTGSDDWSFNGAKQGSGWSFDDSQE